MRYPGSPIGPRRPFPQENFWRWITLVSRRVARPFAARSRRRLPHVSLVVDLMHLVVIVAGVAVGGWALIALRGSLPRGRFAVFGAASAGALFGCAALAGEVGLLAPPAWFAIVMGAMLAMVAAAFRSSRSTHRPA